MEEPRRQTGASEETQRFQQQESLLPLGKGTKRGASVTRAQGPGPPGGTYVIE